MADPKLLDKLPRPPQRSGDLRRPSRRVSLDKYPAIKRRQDINTRLLSHTCANEERVAIRFAAEDVPVLLQIAQERSANTNPLLRRGAIAALGGFQTLEVANALAALGSAPDEHEGVRAHALTVLADMSPQVATAVLMHQINDKSALVRQAAVKGLARTGDKAVAERLAGLVSKDKSAGVKQAAAAAVAAIHTRLGLAVPKLPAVKRPSKPQAPGKDTAK
jgi:HEAT repeat protein